MICCKNCKDRYIGCHSECEKYKAAKKSWEEAKEEERKRKRMDRYDFDRFKYWR